MNGYPSIPELERRMRPGRYSEGGFLGYTESLDALLAQDDRTLRELGVSHEQIAAALEDVLQRAQDQRDRLLASGDHAAYHQREGTERLFDLYPPQSLPSFSPALSGAGVGYPVGDRLQVFMNQYRGLQECPWGCEDERWSSFDFLILDRATGSYVTGPGLIVHLIRKHHFYEGMASPYRVDPVEVVQVLGLASRRKRRRA